jgi:DNA-directed RNA polymerase subunit RPC12/RpoP
MPGKVNSRSRLDDSELLFLKKYRCNNCGQSFEFLQKADIDGEAGLKCIHCGSAMMEPSSCDVQSDFYW